MNFLMKKDYLQPVSSLIQRVPVDHIDMSNFTNFADQIGQYIVESKLITARHINGVRCTVHVENSINSFPP